MAQKLWSVVKWSGGISSGSKAGIPGSFYHGEKLDYRSDPDVLQINKATSKVSGTIATGLVQWISPVNNDVYYYDNTGKFYNRTGGTGTFTLLGTVSTSQGQGMEYFNDYVYLGGSAKVARYGPISGTPSLTDSFATFTNIEYETWLPMTNFINFICVGNGRYLTTYDGSTYTYNDLTLPPNYHIRSLAVITGKYIAIGTYQGSNINNFEQGRIFLWDGTSDTYNDFIEINEGGINAMLFHQNNLYIWAGIRGNIYTWNGNLQKQKRVPFVGDGKYIEVYPGAVTVAGGIPYFGVSNGDSTTVYRGVYSYGQADKNYPTSLNYEHVVSTGTKQGTAVITGAVKGIGPSQFYIGWQDGAGTVGVDQVSTTSYYTQARLESLIFDNQQPYKEKYAKLVKITHEPLATGESIAIEYKLDHNSSWTALGTVSYTNDSTATEKRFPVDWKNKEYQLAAVLAGNGTTSPTLLSLNTLFEELEFV